MKFNDKKAKRSSARSAFPTPDELRYEFSPMPKQNKSFPRVTELNWLSIGRLLEIRLKHSYSEQSEISFDDIYESQSQVDLNNNIGETKVSPTVPAGVIKRVSGHFHDINVFYKSSVNSSLLINISKQYFV